MKTTARFYLKPLYMLEQRRIKQYEAGIVRDFEHTLAVTDIDRELLLQAIRSTSPDDEKETARRISTIPIAVDTKDLQPAARKPGSMNILTLGTLHYPPNADGIRWFFNEVFPKVRRELPNATLTIIGKNPPADFIHLAAQNPGLIEVTGYVEDLQPYFARAALTVVPVRAGSGMRVRLLEAFARAMPAVTTTIGLEGIDARPGEDVLVADTPEDFARAVVRLIKDSSLQARLANNGRCLAVERYDWHPVLRQLEKIYGGKAQ
jgi:glycosyltransferase involved in cell wall biosynthesis